jgi:predicted ATPase
VGVCSSAVSDLTGENEFLPMDMLRKIVVRGFKTLEDVELDLRSLNVLIGANGAGKSNLVSFFRLLNALSAGSLQLYVGRSGGADSVLHYGSKQTAQLEARLDFANGREELSFLARLEHAAGDTFIFAEEEMRFATEGSTEPTVYPLGTGHKESAIRQFLEQKRKPATSRKKQNSSILQTLSKLVRRRRVQELRQLLRGCRAYQFHDTSERASIRQSSRLVDNVSLRSDAGNLASFLHRLAADESHPQAYRRIVGTIRQIAPFFDDFVLEPQGGDDPAVLLRWRERGSEIVFGPHQISDGTLRTMALVTLLLQPEALLPTLLVIDEPELGLHPYALTVIASLLRAVSTHRQVLIATQSMALLDHFQPEDVIVVERRDRASTFSRLDPEALTDWLAEYALSELWEKNVLGGRPGAWPG